MNISIIKGRISRDPEIKTAASGLMIARFSLAVDRIAKKGEKKTADFIPCVAFGTTAETIGKYCEKGKAILVSGHIQTGKYTTESGENRYTTDVIVDRFEFCGSKTMPKGVYIDGDVENSEVPF